MDAYKDYTEKRFLFDENLNYIKSNSPNNRYRIKFEATNMFGDFNKLFVKQLNASFRLNTKIIEKEVIYYELVNIKVNNKTIMPVSKNQGNASVNQSFKELKVNGVYSANSIASLIEKQITYLQDNKYYNEEGNKIYYPVVTKLKEYNTLDISIENESSSVDEWISLLKENGFKLVRKKGKIKYVEIEK